MATEQEPMPWRWYSPGGNDQLWGSYNTYQSVPYDALPPLPTRTDPGLAWLRTMPKPRSPLGPSPSLDLDDERDFGREIDKLTAEAKELGLTVPSALRGFMTDSELYGRVPSCTACYIDLPDRLIPLPDGRPGRLLRFLNDQQCVLLWYLHLLPDGQHVVVCGLPDGDPEGFSLDDNIVALNGVICAPSFEDFVHRFWLENTIWFAVVGERRELSGEERAYIDFAQRTHPAK
ncbi:hypothetical protein FGG08_004957 [Glutinoglossum americanum]|uniref:Uncharacterized protein n=1 Tax=Glutinoglossum americanum TaxID=1670608 RepID=A0A9P8I1A7_9PEZI|nr:hypothetical protein FGG08_004957 [Glutinoglossum americanum]